MRTAICPGSFDPITLGHLNIIRRAAQLFDKVVVCIMVNSTKTSPMFSIEERADMVRRTVGKYPNVTVDTSDGLLAEYARQFEGAVVVKGLRAASDVVREMAKYGADLSGLVPDEIKSDVEIKAKQWRRNNG